MSQDGQGFRFSVFFLESLFVFKSPRIVFEEEDSSFGKGPLEMSVSDLLAAVALPFPGGLFGAFDEPGIGDEVLDPGKPADIVDFIEDDQGEDRSYAMDGSQEKQGVRVMMFGVSEDMPFEAPFEMVDVVDELEVDLDAPLDIRIKELLGDAIPMTAVGDFSAKLWQIALGIGVLDMSQQVRTTPDKICTPPKQIPGISSPAGRHRPWGSYHPGGEQRSSSSQLCRF